MTLISIGHVSESRGVVLLDATSQWPRLSEMNVLSIASRGSRRDEVDVYISPEKCPVTLTVVSEGGEHWVLR